MNRKNADPAYAVVSKTNPRLSYSANGYVRSEAIVAIYVRKSSDAKRIYATVVGTSTNTDGFKLEGATYPSRSVQSRLIRDAYARANLHPTDVHYVEAHGTGTSVRIFANWSRTPSKISRVRLYVGGGQTRAKRHFGRFLRRP